jgi:hypothetical protein
VFPVTNARLEDARNRMVPGVGHLALAFDQVIMKEVLEMMA